MLAVGHTRLNMVRKVARAAMGIYQRNLGAMLAATGLLWGCGSGHEPNTTPKAGGAPAATRKDAWAAETRARYLVTAVAAGKPGSAHVQVKFEIKGRPDIGQPVDVDVVILPVSDSLDRVAGRVTTEDGLELLAGGDIPAVDRPAEGVALPHTVRILPKQDGIFTLRAVLTVDSGSQSATETFQIPVIAGAGMPDLPTPAAATRAPVTRAPPGTKSPPSSTH